MQTNLERINPTKVKLLVTADPEDILAAKKQAISKLSVNIKVPGFRAGKAPWHLAEKYLDANLLGQETLESAINVVYTKAIINEQLRPVNNPKINVKIFVPDEQLVVEAEVDVIGKVNLSNYKGLNIPKENIKISTKEISDVIDRLRNQLATKTKVTRPARDGDELIIDFFGSDTKTKESIAGADGKAYPLVLGSKTFIPGFEDNLIGAEIDQVKDFNLTFPTDYGVEFLKNKKVNFKVTIRSISEPSLPKLDESFVKLVGPFSNLEELKADIKKELSANKQNEALSKQQNKIVKAIVASSKVGIPESLLTEEQSRIEREQRQNAAYKGATWNEYLTSQGIDEAQFNISSKQQAESQIKIGLILGEIASKEKITVSKQDLEVKLEELKLQYSTDPKMQAEIAQPQNQQDIKNRLLVEKTVNQLVVFNDSEQKTKNK